LINDLITIIAEANSHGSDVTNTVDLDLGPGCFVTTIFPCHEKLNKIDSFSGNKYLYSSFFEQVTNNFFYHQSVIDVSIKAVVTYLSIGIVFVDDKGHSHQ